MTIPRRLAACLLLSLAAVSISPAGAQDAEGVVEVIEVAGPLDARLVRFLEQTILGAANRGAEAVVVQLDSPAALTDDVLPLVELVADPPLPVAVWVGPAPAVAYGGAAELLLAASLKLAAPDARVGYLIPTVAGERRRALVQEVPDAALLEGALVLSEARPGVVDDLVAAVGQVVVWLDGLEVTVAGETRRLHTAREVVGEGGAVGLVPTVEVRFHKPDLTTRLLRLSIRPEATFFFLALGLTIAALEFYALGPGLAAAVALLSLLLGGYGLAVLPVRWWAAALVVVGWLLLGVGFQRGGSRMLGPVGTAALVVAGLFLTDAAPQLVPAWWAVLLTVLMVAFFYTLAMPALARSRLSTGTIGRSHLLGRRGHAVTECSPEGVIEVDGARWRAMARRQAGIKSGREVEVTGVAGLYLEVEPRPPPDESAKK